MGPTRVLAPGRSALTGGFAGMRLSVVDVGVTRSGGRFAALGLFVKFEAAFVLFDVAHT